MGYAAFPIGLACPLKAMTGLDCPLCGATRATFALARGDIGAALDFNALYVALLPFLAVLVAMWLLRRTAPTPLRWRRLPLAALVAAAGYMVVRNLPVAPFDYLGT